MQDNASKDGSPTKLRWPSKSYTYSCIGKFEFPEKSINQSCLHLTASAHCTSCASRHLRLTSDPLPSSLCPPPSLLPPRFRWPRRGLFLCGRVPAQQQKKQVNLTTSPGNPVVTCRVNNKYAFVELRSSEECTKALNLNGIPFMGQVRGLRDVFFVAAAHG